MKHLVAPCVLAALMPILAPGGARSAFAQRPSQVAPGPAMRDDDSVRIGCAGGRTGGGSGSTLTREGRFAMYVKPLREAATHTPLRRDSVGAAMVFAALERIRFRALRIHQVGNMTCVLELTDSAGRHAVSWLKGYPPAELAPALAALERTFGDDRRGWP